MEFHFSFQFVNILCMFLLGSFLQKVESAPVSSSELFSPGFTNLSSLAEYLRLNGNDSREVKHNELWNASSNQPEDATNAPNGYPESNANKKLLRKRLLSSIAVPYLCHIEKGMCRLNQNQENLVTFFVPIQLLPNKEPPTEIGLKEFYSLVSKRRKQQMDNLDLTRLNSTAEDQDTRHGVLSRRKRDTQYVEDGYNPQQEWANQGDYEADQSFRVQRNIPSSTSTEHAPTSTENHTPKSADPQAGKQSKRSAGNDEETEEDNFGSPSPDEDYQDDSDLDYHPEKRFAADEPPGTTPKSGDTSTKNQSQLNRRSAMNPSYNYPFFANPDYYYPSQRMQTPFDGISYRSVNAFPMMYMDPNAALWQAKIARSPRMYYQQRQAGGYGRGWPSMSSYYSPYGNRYQQNYGDTQQHEQRGHYHHQYPQQSSYNPYSYGYAQGNRNYKGSATKPVETDAAMYYGA